MSSNASDQEYVNSPMTRDLRDAKKLHGYKDRWRIRVGDYRIVYTINDAKRTVDMTRIAHRRDVYER
jgi:addiction module RelE/StbE family toxin